MKQNELVVSLWCDFEPFGKEWGNWSCRNFWQSAYDLGYPQTSLNQARHFMTVLDRYNIPCTWGIFSCEPFFQWFDFLSDFFKIIDNKNDCLTIHPHWVDWKEKWERCRIPSPYHITKSLEPLKVLLEHKNYCNLIRSGWNTQISSDGRLLMDIYKEKGFYGIGDIPKKNFEYKFRDDFLLLPYDSDSMDECKSKWVQNFTYAINRAKRSGAIFSWWFHIHEVHPLVMNDLLSWSYGEAKEHGVDLKFMNVNEICRYLK